MYGIEFSDFRPFSVAGTVTCIPFLGNTPSSWPISIGPPLGRSRTTAGRRSPVRSEEPPKAGRLHHRRSPGAEGGSSERWSEGVSESDQSHGGPGWCCSSRGGCDVTGHLSPSSFHPPAVGTGTGRNRATGDVLGMNHGRKQHLAGPRGSPGEQQPPPPTDLSEISLSRTPLSKKVQEVFGILRGILRSAFGGEFTERPRRRVKSFLAADLRIFGYRQSHCNKSHANASFMFLGRAMPSAFTHAFGTRPWCRPLGPSDDASQ